MSRTRRFSLFLPILVPLAARWAEHHERRILRLGSPLSPQALEDAKRMGVRHPERIRVMEVDRIPLLNSPPLAIAARFLPGVTANTIGLSMRYGIYLRRCAAGSRILLAHECVHTAQYERFGSIEEFLARYLAECLEYGYPAAPLELEAVAEAARISGPASAS